MRVISRILFVLVLGLVAAPVVGGQPAAHACAPDIEQALAAANTVFVGEVTAVSERDRLATMRVVEVWKGRALVDVVEVEGWAESPEDLDANDRRFQSGRTYLVFSQDVRPPFSSDGCTATKLYNPLGGNVIPGNFASILGTNQARQPIVTDTEAVGEMGASWLPFLNIGLVILGIVAVVLMYRRLTRIADRNARVAAAEKAAAAEKKATEGPKQDSLSKVGRKLSVTGAFGRSGMDSSRRLRKRKKDKSVSTRSLDKSDDDS